MRNLFMLFHSLFHIIELFALFSGCRYNTSSTNYNTSKLYYMNLCIFAFT